MESAKEVDAAKAAVEGVHGGGVGIVPGDGAVEELGVDLSRRQPIKRAQMSGKRIRREKKTTFSKRKDPPARGYTHRRFLCVFCL